MKISFLLILVSILLAGCKFEAAINPNELTEPLLVENEVVGWKIEVPAGWEMISEEETQERQDRGFEAIEESMDLEIDASGMLQLLNIKKNATNVLAITAQPFFEEYIDEWKATNIYLQEILFDTYENKDITPEMSVIETEQIYGLEFSTYSIILLNEDSEINQTIYSSLHNGFDVSVILTYTDDAIKDEMFAIWRSSKFDIRKMPDSLIEHYAKMEKEFTAAIVLGDQTFEQSKYGEAMFWYEKAHNLNPLQPYAADKFEECQRLADDISDTEYQVLQSYQKIVAKADALFNEQDYKAALDYYDRALGFQPENSYAKDRIILIKDTILIMDYSEDWKPA
jgi:tetratricopeptide (TPR) repeat protein